MWNSHYHSEHHPVRLDPLPCLPGTPWIAAIWSTTDPGYLGVHRTFWPDASHWALQRHERGHQRFKAGCAV